MARRQSAQTAKWASSFACSAALSSPAVAAAHNSRNSSCTAIHQMPRLFIGLCSQQWLIAGSRDCGLDACGASPDLDSGGFSRWRRTGQAFRRSPRTSAPQRNATSASPAALPSEIPASFASHLSRKALQQFDRSLLLLATADQFRAPCLQLRTHGNPSTSFVVCAKTRAYKRSGISKSGHYPLNRRKYRPFDRYRETRLEQGHPPQQRHAKSSVPPRAPRAHTGETEAPGFRRYQQLCSQGGIRHARRPKQEHTRHRPAAGYLDSILKRLAGKEAETNLRCSPLQGASIYPIRRRHGAGKHGQDITLIVCRLIVVRFPLLQGAGFRPSHSLRKAYSPASA